MLFFLAVNIKKFVGCAPFSGDRAMVMRESQDGSKCYFPKCLLFHDPFSNKL